MSGDQIRDELSDLDEGETYQETFSDNNGSLGTEIQQQQSDIQEKGENPVENSQKNEEGPKQQSKFVNQLKASSNKFVQYVKETTGNVKSSVQQIDFSMEKEALKSLKDSTVDVFSNMGQRAMEGGSWVWQAGKNMANATGQRMRRQSRSQSLQVLCKQEVYMRPCPRVILCCANALVMFGLKERGIFEDGLSQEPLDNLIDLFDCGSGSVIIPPNTSAHQIAGLMKQFLYALPEPILTYKNVPELTSANTPLERSIVILFQLPPPNATCVQLLLELLNYVIKHQKINGMEANRLAQAVSPCLLWKPQAKAQRTPRTQQQQAADSVSETSDDQSENSLSSQKIPLTVEESKAFETVLGHWISNYHHIYFNTVEGPILKTNVDVLMSKDNSEASSRQDD